MRIPIDLSDAFTLMAAMGVGAIVDDAVRGVRLSVTPDAATIDAGALTDTDIARIVHEHAVTRAAGSWVAEVGSLDGAARAPLSPRIGMPSSAASWETLQRQRHASIDAILRDQRLDTRFVGALGEPAYWARGRDRVVVDFGANAWEMKTRNRGEEFVQNRLALLAASVAARSESQVLAGLTGASVRDEVGKDASTSRTPTGLRAPGRSDNALAWCALWAMSLFPVRPVMSGAGPTARRSRTGGVVYQSGASWFGIPVFGSQVSVARVRGVARSAALAEVVRAAASGGGATAGRVFLARHGVNEVRVFRQYKSANDKAPEPWLLPGFPVPTGRDHEHPA